MASFTRSSVGRVSLPWQDDPIEIVQGGQQLRHRVPLAVLVALGPDAVVPAAVVFKIRLVPLQQANGLVQLLLLLCQLLLELLQLLVLRRLFLSAGPGR